MAEGPWGPGVAVVPPTFSNFFLLLLYYYFILLFTHDHEYGPPIISICVILYVGHLSFMATKMLFTLKKKPIM